MLTLDDSGTLRVFPKEGGEELYAYEFSSFEMTYVSASVHGSSFAVDREGNLFALWGLLSPEKILDACSRALPAGLDRSQRLRLGLSKEISDWCARRRKWPAIAGDSAVGVTSRGQMLDMVRLVIVTEAVDCFRELLVNYKHGAADELAGAAMAIWHHQMGALSHLMRIYKLNIGNEDWEVAGNTFYALVDVAAEYRSTDLPKAMVALYNGPLFEGLDRWRN